MGLLFAIILILLGVVFLALQGMFERFPDSWEWVGIILAGVGVVMGAPSIFQMIMGRPKLVFNFDRVIQD